MDKPEKEIKLSELKFFKPFMAITAGNILFFMLLFTALSVFSSLGITPYGEFTEKFLKGDLSKVDLNSTEFQDALANANWFLNSIVVPPLAVLMGICAGAIMASYGGIIGAVTAMPPAMQIYAQAIGDPSRNIYISLLMGAAIVGGVLGAQVVHPVLAPKLKPFFKDLFPKRENK